MLKYFLPLLSFVGIGMILSGCFVMQRASISIMRNQEIDAEEKNALRKNVANNPWNEALMTLLFILACGYFGWVVLFRMYGILSVITVVVCTAVLSAYGSYQRLRHQLLKLQSLSKAGQKKIRNGQIWFCAGLPVLILSSLWLCIYHVR
ncbi:MAG: hypothetical protein WCS73_03525 [Lentisphaeria bacterium]